MHADSYLGSPDDLHHVPDHQVRRVHFQLARKLRPGPVRDEDRSIRTEAKKLADLPKQKVDRISVFARSLESVSRLFVSWLLAHSFSLSLSLSLSFYLPRPNWPIRTHRLVDILRARGRIVQNGAHTDGHVTWTPTAWRHKCSAVSSDFTSSKTSETSQHRTTQKRAWHVPKVVRAKGPNFLPPSVPHCQTHLAPRWKPSPWPSSRATFRGARTISRCPKFRRRASPRGSGGRGAAARRRCGRGV